MALSQTDFGRAAGVGLKTQFNYEIGVRAPDTEYLAKAAALGVDIRYVITGARDYEPPPPLTSEEQVLLGYWRQASGETRKAALGALVGATAGRNRQGMQVGQYIDGDQHIRGDNLKFGFVEGSSRKPKR